MNRSSRKNSSSGFYIDLEDKEIRKKLASMLMKLFEYWELNQKS